MASFFASSASSSYPTSGIKSTYSDYLSSGDRTRYTSSRDTRYTSSRDTGSHWPTDSGRSSYGVEKHGEIWREVYWDEYDKTIKKTFEDKAPRRQEGLLPEGHSNPWDYSRPGRTYLRRLRREGRERAQRNPVAFPQNTAPLASFETHLLTSLQQDDRRYNML
eukprot:TRINITY_DN4108_c1_g1_i1.p1 TRINITY_DN4108_c1_g1~~TRINITY_DN4108_c1_g1_i1.p1  ORF type:complete len:163 (+),score=11.83 TRINITY_DN4108_c1_g1_i1:76-564(+)